MPKYRFTGDSARSIPALSLVVQPGETVEVAEEINHPDFQPVKEAARKTEPGVPGQKEG